MYKLWTVYTEEFQRSEKHRYNTNADDLEWNAANQLDLVRFHLSVASLGLALLEV